MRRPRARPFAWLRRPKRGLGEHAIGASDVLRPAPRIFKTITVRRSANAIAFRLGATANERDRFRSCNLHQTRQATDLYAAVLAASEPLRSPSTPRVDDCVPARSEPTVNQAA